MGNSKQQQHDPTSSKSFIRRVPASARRLPLNGLERDHVQKWRTTKS